AHEDKRLKPSDYELVRKIKEQVQNLLDLEIPPENAYITLETDGCMEGWGGIIKWKKSKEDPRSSERICAYASGKFSTTQSIIDAEINACINTLEKLKIYYKVKWDDSILTFVDNNHPIPVLEEKDDKNKKDAVESSEKGIDASKKIKGGPRMKRQSKRKKTDSDLEEEEHLKTFLKIVPDKEGIIDFEVLEKRFLIINWESKFYHFDRHGAEVHTLTLEDGTEIHMLAERRYPLTKETLERMISLKLIAESASDSAYDLLRFIQKQIDKAVI
ncbi:putative polyprotein, partial [Tanacetum coccineum]